MAHLAIKCIDAEGNEVEFVTSEHEGKVLMENYAMYQKWLTDNGFKQIQNRKMKPKVTTDGKTCPKCNGEIWDNREKIKSGEFGEKSPELSCRDKDCGWAVWKGQYEIQT